MRVIRWGIMGTGRMADALAREMALLRDAGVQLAAVASRSTDRARAFADRHAIPHALGDYAALAAGDAVDAIYVATPHSLHAAHMLACVQGGKATLCEKPFTLNAGEARRVIAAAQTRGVFVMEAMWTRFLPAVTALRELIAGGAIGRVQLLVGGGAFLPDRSQPHYLLDRSLGGGVLLDAGVYLLSMASMLLGAPSRCQANGLIGDTGVDEQDAILLDHPGGAAALLYVSLRSRRSPDLEILGDGGRIQLAAPVFRPERLSLWRADGTASTSEHPIAGSGYGYQIRAVSEAVRAGRLQSSVMPLDETLTIMETMDAVRRQIGLRYEGESG
jgi:predicted dehydrogenase